MKTFNTSEVYFILAKRYNPTFFRTLQEPSWNAESQDS